MQECLGLHRARAVSTAEVTAGFQRDGVTGPSTLSLAAQSRGLFAVLETGADQAAGKSAFSANGLAGTVGVRRMVRGAAVCGGISLAGEKIGDASVRSRALLTAIGVPVKALPKLGLNVFAVARLEQRDVGFTAGADEKESGVAFRVGAATYPVSWLGLRVFGDFAAGSQRGGFSVSAPFALKR